MNRRKFIKNMLIYSGALGTYQSGVPFVFSPKTANASENKTLVKIFLRGGCDGLNMIVPYGDSRYYQLRPTISIPPPDSTLSSSALELNGFFGMHPSMKGLHEIFHQGNLAIMPATHYPNASKSHFLSQDLLELAGSVDESDGWLNRLLSENQNSGQIRAIGLGKALPLSLKGQIPVTSVNNLETIGFGISEEKEAAFRNGLEQAYSSESMVNGGKGLFKKFGYKMLNDIEGLKKIQDVESQGNSKVVYPDSKLARELKIAAQAIKANIGMEIANIDVGGWDTHSEQGSSNGRQAARLKDLSECLTAFYEDIGDTKMENVSVLICTEFGRTVKENGSAGTDHGFASAWMVLGGAIRGGLYGDWPGLGKNQLVGDNGLDMSIDFRDIYSEIIAKHWDIDIARSVIKDYEYRNIGFYA